MSKLTLTRKPLDNVSAWLLLAPFIFLYGIVFLFPLVKGFIISLFRWRITGPVSFEHIGNYIELFREPLFWSSLWHTTLYVIISIPAIVFGPFLVAVLIDHKRLIGRTVYRVIFFLPNVLAVSIVAIIWTNVLQPYFGLANLVLRQFGVSNDIFWLTDHRTVWIAIVVVAFWWRAGYYMIIYLAGLQGIPDELYESADIEGASWIQTMRYITMPSISRIFVLVNFLHVVSSFKIFPFIFLLTEGGPGGATRTYMQFIYETGFQRLFIGRASAASFMLFLVILAVSGLQARLLKREGDRY